MGDVIPFAKREVESVTTKKPLTSVRVSASTASCSALGCNNPVVSVLSLVCVDGGTHEEILKFFCDEHSPKDSESLFT